MIPFEPQPLQPDLSDLIERMSDGFFVLDRHWRFVLVNNIFEQVFRRSRQEMLGRNIFDVFPALSGSTFEKRYREVMESGTAIVFETYFPPTGGWYEVRAHSGRAGLEVYFRDITDGRRAQEEAQEMALRFSSVVEASMDGFILFESTRDAYGKIEDFVFIEVNHQAERYLAYTREELIGKRLSEVFSAAPDQGSFEKYVKVVESGIPLEEEQPVHSNDQAPTWVRRQVVKVGDGFAISTRDITQKKVEEEAVRRSERLYRTIIEHAREAIFTLSRAGRLGFMSDSWYTLLGHDPGESAGSFLSDLLHQDDAPGFEAFLARVLEEPRFNEILDVRIRHADGSYRHHSLAVAGVRDDSGRAMFLVGFSQDNTERRSNQLEVYRLTEEVGRLREQVSVLEQVKGPPSSVDFAPLRESFLANISHELRTPLNGVMGLVELLRNEDLSDSARGRVDTVLANGTRLLGVLDDMVELARTGPLDLSAQMPTDLARLCREVFDRLAGTAAEGVRVDVVLPEAPIPLLKVDGVRLRQVVGNLMSNAIRYTSQGRIKLELRAQRIGGFKWSIRIDLSDTGIGIPADRLGSVFNAFAPMAGSSRRFGATGLGLSVAHQIVERLGGRIGVESTEGVGSRFWVDLELVEAVEAVQAVAMLPPSPRWSGVRVLLAEDNPVNALVARQMLERLGCMVEHAENGVRALDLAVAREFDIVFMDLQMPELDGLEATRMLRAINPDSRLPIIALTANANDIDRNLAKQSGMNDFLTKPIDSESLLRVLLTWVVQDPSLPTEPL